MRSIVVTTKEQLKQAMKDKVPEIIVEGELASSMIKIGKLRKYSKYALYALVPLIGVAAIAAVPTGGASIAAAGVAAKGLSVTVGGTVIAASLAEVAIVFGSGLLGLKLLFDFFSQYDEGEATTRGFHLKRKSKD